MPSSSQYLSLNYPQDYPPQSLLLVIKAVIQLVLTVCQVVSQVLYVGQLV